MLICNLMKPKVSDFPLETVVHSISSSSFSMELFGGMELSLMTFGSHTRIEKVRRFFNCECGSGPLITQLYLLSP